MYQLNIKEMKKFGLILGMMMIFSGFSFAQSGNDYKSRNHKLNKHNQHTKETIKPIATKESTVETNAFAYQKRNHKFHNKTNDNVLAIKKDSIIYDYKAFNHKFAKGQNNGQFIKRISKGDMLSSNE